MSAMKHYQHQLEEQKRLLVESWARSITSPSDETKENMKKIVDRLRAELPQHIVEQCRIDAQLLISGIKGKQADDWLFGDYEQE